MTHLHVNELFLQLKIWRSYLWSSADLICILFWLFSSPRDQLSCLHHETFTQKNLWPSVNLQVIWENQGLYFEITNQHSLFVTRATWTRRSCHLTCETAQTNTDCCHSLALLLKPILCPRARSNVNVFGSTLDAHASPFLPVTSSKHETDWFN